MLRKQSVKAVQYKISTYDQWDFTVLMVIGAYFITIRLLYKQTKNYTEYHSQRLIHSSIIFSIDLI